jgi:hypothetical protein
MPGTMGPPDPEQIAAAKERAARKEEERRVRHDIELRTQMIHDARKRSPEEFLGLGLVVQDGQVLEWSTAVVNVLGPLAGAQAGIVDSLKTKGATSAAVATVLFGVPGAVAALARRGTKPFAYVVFPDGTLYQNELTDKRVAARAQADALRFNALAKNAGDSTS